MDYQRTIKDRLIFQQRLYLPYERERLQQLQRMRDGLIKMIANSLLHQATASRNCRFIRLLATTSTFPTMEILLLSPPSSPSTVSPESRPPSLLRLPEATSGFPPSCKVSNLAYLPSPPISPASRPGLFSGLISLGYVPTNRGHPSPESPAPARSARRLYLLSSPFPYIFITG